MATLRCTEAGRIKGPCSVPMRCIAKTSFSGEKKGEVGLLRGLSTDVFYVEGICFNASVGQISFCII